MRQTRSEDSRPDDSGTTGSDLGQLRSTDLRDQVTYLQHELARPVTGLSEVAREAEELVAQCVRLCREVNPEAALDLDSALARIRTRRLDAEEAMSQALVTLAFVPTGDVEVRPERVRVSMLVGSAWEDLSGPRGSVGRATKLELVGDLAAQLIGDRRLLKLALKNLLANGLKYGTSDTVRVEIRSVAEHVLIQVTTWGPLIDLSSSAQLFEPFVRGHATLRSATPAGLGLGLYVARQIAVAHGGAAELTESQREFGGDRDARSTFQLRIPAAPQGDRSKPFELAANDGD